MHHIINIFGKIILSVPIHEKVSIKRELLITNKNDEEE